MTKKSIEELLELNGFVFERRNKHVIWKDKTTGHNFVYSSTPSDWRVDIKRVKDLRKLCLKLGREFNDGREIKVKERFLHRPFEEALKQEPQLVETEKSSEVVVRRVDEVAIEIVRQRAAAKVKQADIAKELNEIGYTTSKGGPIVQSMISSLMREHEIPCLNPQIGKGWINAKKKKKKIKVPRSFESAGGDAEPARPAKKRIKSGWITSVEEIVTSNLSATLKEKFILEIVREAVL